MEKRNIVNSIIIENNRIDLTPYFGKLDEDSHVISWKALGYMAKPVKGSLIIGEEYKKYSILPKCKKYAARFPNFPLYTNEEGLQFVSYPLSRNMVGSPSTRFTTLPFMALRNMMEGR